MIKTFVHSQPCIGGYSGRGGSATGRDKTGVLEVQHVHYARNRAMRVFVLIAQFHLLIFICAVWGFNLTAGFNAEDLIYPASLLILLIYVWSLWSWNLFNRSLFDPYTLFLTSVALFNGGQAFLEVFHLNENGILAGAFASETILKSLLLVAMGISGLHLGALLSAGMIRRQHSPARMAPPVPLQCVRWVAWSMLLIA